MTNLTEITPRQPWFLKPEMFEHIGVDERYEGSPLLPGLDPKTCVIWEVVKLSKDRTKAQFNLTFHGVLMAVVNVTLEDGLVLVKEV